MRAHFIPPVLTIASAMALAGIVSARVPPGLEDVAVWIAVGAAIGYVVGTDWWLWHLGRSPLGPAGALRRRIGILALGLPTAVVGVGIMAIIITAGDVMWMILPFAVVPPLLVWPFVIGALRQVRGPVPADA